MLEVANDEDNEGEKTVSSQQSRRQVQRLGDVLRAANRRRWWSEPEVEDDGDGGVRERSVMLCSARMKLAMIQSSGTRRWSEGVAGRGGSRRCVHGGFGQEGESEGARGREQRGTGVGEGAVLAI